LAAAQIPQQAIVIAPFGDGHTGQRFSPGHLAGHPRPRVKRHAGFRQGFSVYNLFRFQVHRFSLADDQVQMTVL
jgi:hypothetical protein